MKWQEWQDLKSGRLPYSAKPERIGGESEGYDRPNRKEQRKRILCGLCIRWSRIATAVADLFVLGEDSVARLAANHISIKPNKRFSVYRPCVPFILKVSIGVPVCGA
jgi:hypothetical protein